MSKTTTKMSKGRITIDTDRCKGCAYCVNACDKGLIAMGQELNRLGYFTAVCAEDGDCTGCTLCAWVCPEIAIEVWRDE